MELVVTGKPRRFRARPTPAHLKKELNCQIDDLLQAHVIELAPDSLWVLLCHLVPKPRSDKWYLAIDYCYLNTVL